MATLTEGRPAGQPGGRPADRDFPLLYLVMLTIAAGNTALQSVMPAVGRLLQVGDLVVGITFSFSALVWTIAAPAWARRSDRRGRKAMIGIGLSGFCLSMALCGLALTAGLLGWIGPVAAFGCFILGRLVYGALGAAAPPAAQAVVAGRTSRADRTNALAMLASAFGLGTIIGPALAPFLLLPVVGMAGPAYIFVGVGIVVTLVVMRLLSNDGPMLDPGARGANTSEPSIGGQPSGASVIAAANAPADGRIRLRDPRIWPWMVAGIIAGHAQAMTGQALAFLVMDQLRLPPTVAQPMIGTVLMAGAGAALLAQWGLIPRLGLGPRALILWGSAISALGCLAVPFATNVHALAVAFAFASIGFGFLRPGFTAGASLAVGAGEQGVVAGKVTAVNGAVFVLGPSIGIGLYEIAPPLPYLVAAAALVVLLAYTWRTLIPSIDRAE